MLDVATYNLLRSFIKRDMSEYPGSPTNYSTSVEYGMYTNSLIVNNCYESQFSKCVIEGRTVKRVFSDNSYRTVEFSSSSTSGTSYAVNNGYPFDINKRYFMVYDVINNTMPVSYYISKPSVPTVQSESSVLISAKGTGLFVTELSMKTDKTYGYFVVSGAKSSCKSGSITYRREIYECPAEFTLEDFNTNYKFDFPSESILAQDEEWVTVSHDSINPYAKSVLYVPEVTANTKYVLLIDIAENTMNRNYAFCSWYSGTPFKFGGSVKANSIGSYMFILETVDDISNISSRNLLSQTSDNTRCQGSITFKRTLIDYDTYVTTSYNPAGLVSAPNTLYINNNSFAIPYELNGITTLVRGFYDEFIVNEDGSGEYIQRIGKLVLDGDDSIIINTDATNQTETIAWQSKKNLGNMAIKYAENAETFETLVKEFPSGSENTFLNDDVEQICVYNGYVCGRLLRSKISSADVDGIKAYFATNPITVYYIMKIPAVTHIPYESMPIYKIRNGANCFKIPGNLNCWSSFRIASDIADSIKSLDERIYELEIMLMELSNSI